MNLEIIKRVNVDFHNAKYIQINAKQYDVSSRYILVTCYNQGSIFRVDNIYNSAYVRYRKSDGLNVFNCCEITKDGEILIELTEQMLAYVGKCYIDLVIVHNEPIDVNNITVNNGELLTSENTSILSTMLLCVNVIESALDNHEIESTNEYNALNELLIKATTEYDHVIKASKISEDNAKLSEINAKSSEEKSSVSEANSKTSETNAKESELNAKTSETNAKESELNAKASENSAKTYKEEVENNANFVTTKTEEALEYATNAADSSLLSKSYAVGDTDVRDGENTDNSKYYYLQTKAINDNLGGTFSPQGTIKYSELQSVIKAKGNVYHISDAFITDETFKVGAGVSYPAGTTVYCTYDGYWDILVVNDLNIIDDGFGNVEIVCSYDFVNTYDGFGVLNKIVAELQQRVKELEDQTVLEVVE
jgi:hypothetical protein